MKKISLLIRQYGLLAVFKKFASRFISPFVRRTTFIVLAINHDIRQRVKGEVKRMTYDDIYGWEANGIIDHPAASLFNGFLKDGCKGYYLKENDDLAAWGFVQTYGSYKYGNYYYQMPEKIHNLKNLYVKPEHRGKSFGKMINEARINDIPANCTPVVFVIPENRYALRNLKIYGFEEYLMVQHISCFNRWQKRKIKILRHGEMSELLMEGFLKPDKV